MSGSSHDAGRVPFHVIDKDPESRWFSKRNDGEWITLQLVEPRKVAVVKLHWCISKGRSDILAGYATDYEIQVSTDGDEWETVFKDTEGDGGGDTITFEPRECSYIRMIGLKRGTDNGLSLYSFDVFEKKE